MPPSEEEEEMFYFSILLKSVSLVGMSHSLAYIFYSYSKVINHGFYLYKITNKDNTINARENSYFLSYI